MSIRVVYACLFMLVGGWFVPEPVNASETLLGIN